MKRNLLLLTFIIFCFFINSKAYAQDVMYLNYLEDGALIQYNQAVKYSYGTGIFSIAVLYMDVNENIIEAYVLDGGKLYGVNDYDNFGFSSFYVGETCKEAYLRFSESAKVDGVETWCDKLSIYSKFDSLEKISYWNVYESSKSELESYCTSDSNLVNSDICKDIVMNFSGPVFLFKEYAPVSFELVCEPEEVKKGETSQCNLMIKADTEVNEIAVPLNSELYNVDSFNKVDGWNLVDNNDGTVTIISEDGFVGEGVVLGATLRFNEDVADSVDIELNDISYITSDGIELNGSAKDNVNIYDEPGVSDDVKNDDGVENPKTSDIFSIVVSILLIVVFVGMNLYRRKIN